MHFDDRMPASEARTIRRLDVDTFSAASAYNQCYVSRATGYLVFVPPMLPRDQKSYGSETIKCGEMIDPTCQG